MAGWKIPVLLSSRALQTLTLQPDSTTGKDVSLQADTPTTDNSSNTSCHAIMTAAPAARRAVIQFDLSSILTGKTIRSAILSLTCNSSKGAGQVDLYRQIQAWTHTGATWNTYNGVNSWTSAGGDYN